MLIDASGLEHRALNEKIKESGTDCRVTGCCGQRFIGAGMGGCDITVDGVPGNALGAYLNGGTITVNGNAQDAVGDTMNAGTIVINGSAGDAAGYAMRGGRIFIRDNAGYRAGIHMKAYRDNVPVMVIGGCAGSFLGEYQAGGIIVVLGLGCGPGRIVGDFPSAGMHGGKLFLRCSENEVAFPPQVHVRPLTPDDREELTKVLSDFCGFFGLESSGILDDEFIVAVPDSSNPYRQLYAAN